MAERLRINRVRIQVGERTFELSWAVAQELQARMLRAKATERVVDELQRVGTSRPAVLTQWAKELGPERLPPGVQELLDALQVELDAIN